MVERVQMLAFRILGPFEATRDGVVVEISGQRQLAALVALLLSPNRVVPAERIVDAVWGEQPPATAAAALRNTVVQLRKLLGNDAIETRPAGYVLRVDPESVDVLLFEGLI